MLQIDGIQLRDLRHDFHDHVQHILSDHFPQLVIIGIDQIIDIRLKKDINLIFLIGVQRDAEILLNPVGKLSDQRQLLGIFRHDLADFR